VENLGDFVDFLVLGDCFVAEMCGVGHGEQPVDLAALYKRQVGAGAWERRPASSAASTWTGRPAIIAEVLAPGCHVP
jgi:hypothetical protein